METFGLLLLLFRDGVRFHSGGGHGGTPARQGGERVAGGERGGGQSSEMTARYYCCTRCAIMQQYVYMHAQHAT